MDARALLDSVAAAYGALETLQGEALAISQSEEEGWSQRTEARLKFYYAAPGRIRVEQPGRMGSVMVSDGIELKSFFAQHRRYFRHPAPPPDQLPGVFLPELPMAPGHGPVLFGTIGQRVLEAELRSDETLTLDGAEIPCHVVEAMYKPSHSVFAGANRPVHFWIDARRCLVLRMEGDLDLGEAVAGVARRTLAITRIAANREIPAGTFEFTPPEGALEHGAGMGRGGGQRG